MNKQNHEIRFKVTKEQHDKLQGNADKCGRTIKDYLLHVGMNIEIEIKIKSRE